MTNEEKAQAWIDREHHNTGHAYPCRLCIASALAAAVQAKGQNMACQLLQHADDVPEPSR